MAVMQNIDSFIPSIKDTLEEKLEKYLDITEDNPFVHMNEGYVVSVRMSGELEATEAIGDYLRRKAELIY